MEFSYRLTEEDYMKASKIKVKYATGRPWARFLSRFYLVLFLITMWLTFASGRILEWLDVTGDKLGKLAIGSLLISSILPTLILSFLVIVLYRALLFWPRMQQRREQYGSNAGCQVETTVTLSPLSIAFRSEMGQSESRLKNYAAWSSRNGILVLATQAGVRQIVKIGGLPPAQQSELLKLLTDALPQK
jgi:hypothetical protein